MSYTLSSEYEAKLLKSNNLLRLAEVFQGRIEVADSVRNIEHVPTWDYPNKPAPMATVTLTMHHVDGKGGDRETPCEHCTYEGTVLGYDESGEFALIAWEDGTRDYRYIHQGYDYGMNETMEW